MPPFYQNRLDQKALLWEWQANDKYARPIVLAQSEEIDCRWERSSVETDETESLVYQKTASVLVDREIAEGSILWEGGEDDLTGTSGIPSSNFFIVVGSFIVPTIKNRGSLIKLQVERWGDELPTTV